MGLFDDFSNAVQNATGTKNIGQTVNNAIRNPGQAITDLAGNASGLGGDTLRNPGRAIQNLGNGARSVLGSAGYLTPLGPAMIGQDLQNINDNRNDAQNAENQAREQAGLDTAALNTTRQHQIDYANTLAKNASSNEKGLLDQVAGNNRRTMAEQIHGAKENAASRGLLGSGFEKMNQANARSQAAANTAESQNQIHQQTQQQIQDANDLAINLGLQIGGVQQSQSDQYYQMAIQNLNKQNAALSNLGVGAGQVTGAAIAGNNNPYSALSQGQLNANQYNNNVYGSFGV